MRRLVVDLMSSSPHQRIPDDAKERLLRTPLVHGARAEWEIVFIGTPSTSSGDGADRVSDETMNAVKSAEAYFGFGLPPQLVEGAPMLRWAHSASAGVASVITPALRKSGVTLTNSAGVYAEPMADTVLAGVLHFARGLDFAVRQQRESRWDQLPFQNATTEIHELDELRVLVIGAGGIGSAVARRFTALRCTCTGIRRRPERGIPEGFASIAGPDDVDRLLPDADVVVVSAPLTSESAAMLDARRLALLPRGAIVVNVARGGLIDDAALLAALDDGLRGAVLDVFSTEPLPPESPYWHHPRVLVTPHVSGVTPRRQWIRAIDLFEDNWQRWAAGEPLRNVVDLDAGY